MTLWQSITGVMQVEIICPCPEEMLTVINVDKIRVLDIIPLSKLSFVCTVCRRDYDMLWQAVVRRGGSAKCVHKSGIFWTILSLKKRPVLIAALMMLLVLTVFLPTRVLFIEVEDNVKVPTALILEAADLSGIRFGVSREYLRSEVFKNSLLEQLPQLEWAGVNTKGCTARISVKERTENELALIDEKLCSIVAARDGVISSMTIIKGDSLCQVGDEVKEGQLLVSAYTDCGLVVKATGADAEVFAETKREVSVIAPGLAAIKDGNSHYNIKYSIFLGKKLINISRNSGIPNGTCVKMYKKRNFSLPGGFVLPVGILAEYQQVQTDVLADDSIQDNVDWILQYTQNYIETLMISGCIQESEYSMDHFEDCTLLSGVLTCVEMIGRIQVEERFE